MLSPRARGHQNVSGYKWCLCPAAGDVLTDLSTINWDFFFSGVLEKCQSVAAARGGGGQSAWHLFLG